VFREFFEVRLAEASGAFMAFFKIAGGLSFGFRLSAVIWSHSELAARESESEE
jgi:hypothetical protein